MNDLTDEPYYTEPDDWRLGDRCPFCLASEGVLGCGHGRFRLCTACGARAVYPGEHEYDDLPDERFIWDEDEEPTA